MLGHAAALVELDSLLPDRVPTVPVVPKLYARPSFAITENCKWLQTNRQNVVRQSLPNQRNVARGLK